MLRAKTNQVTLNNYGNLDNGLESEVLFSRNIHVYT